MKLRFLGIAASLALFGTAFPAVAASYTFTTLDDPVDPGTRANGINDSAQIVGYFGNKAQGFLLSSGSYTTLNFPGITVDETQAWGINNSGQIVGVFHDATGVHGFVNNGGIYTALNYPSRVVKN